MSGAMIRISKSEDPNTSPSTERQIVITGAGDSVALAKSLINMSLDLHKASLERAKSSDDEDGDSDVPASRSRGGRGLSRDDRPREHREHMSRYYSEGGPMVGGPGPAGDGLSGLASLLTKPDVLAAVNILGQLSSIGGGSPAGTMGQVRQPTHCVENFIDNYFQLGGGYSRGGRSSYGSRGGSREDAERHRENKRSKFAPY